MLTVSYGGDIMSTLMRGPPSSDMDDFNYTQETMRTDKNYDPVSTAKKIGLPENYVANMVKSKSIQSLQSNIQALATALNFLYGIEADENTCKKFSASPTGRQLARELIKKLNQGQTKLYDDATTKQVKTAFSEWLKPAKQTNQKK